MKGPRRSPRAAEPPTLFGARNLTPFTDRGFVDNLCLGFVIAGCGCRGTKGVFYESLLVYRGESLVCALGSALIARCLVPGMRAFFDDFGLFVPDCGYRLAAR